MNNMKKNIIAALILALILVMAVSAENIGFTYYMSEAMGGMCISGIAGEKAHETVIIPAESYDVVL